MNYFISVLLFLGLFSVVYAQNNFGCATDIIHQHLFDEHPEIQQKVIDNYNQLEAFTQQFIQQQNAQSKGVISYTIPVVFHVIHNHGVENVSTSQILDGLRILNEGYQKRNPDTANLVPQFKSIAADCEIEFKLAQIDPDGNCTSGITRHVDSSTYSGYHNVKDIVHWDPSKYLNIYICAQAAGLAGHSLMPPSADTVPQWDGIVLQHTYLGSIGTSNLIRSVVLTHEVGHYLNLQHTWGGNNVPNFPYIPVGDPNNCNYDDGVSDTPNTIGNQSQNLNATSCGSLDNVQNFMEYSYLNSMFTEGQKQRIHAALNSPIANRNNLWTSANLTATGINGTPQLCSVDFDADKYFLCVGDSVLLSDVSLHGVSSRSWNISGGNVSFSSSDSSFYYIFTTPGLYTVQLDVSNGSQSGSITKQIEVFDVPSDRTALLESFEGLTSLANSHWFTKDTTDNWHIATNVGYNSNQSVVLTNFDDFSGRKTELTAKPIDVSFANSLVLSFDYAFAKKTASTNDKLRVQVSKNCGKNWITRKQISGNNLPTVNDSVATPFTPTNSDWKNVIVTNLNSSYFVDHLMVRFQFEGKGGNNIYIDNVNLYDPAYSSIIKKEENKMYVFPNPANDFVQLNFSQFITNPIISIVDLSGKIVRQTQENGNVITTKIDVSSLAKGFYILRVSPSLQTTLIIR